MTSFTNVQLSSDFKFSDSIGSVIELGNLSPCIRNLGVGLGTATIMQSFSLCPMISMDSRGKSFEVTT